MAGPRSTRLDLNRLPDLSLPENRGGGRGTPNQGGTPNEESALYSELKRVREEADTLRH